VQHALVFIGCVLFVDALVGEKGLLETQRREEEYEQLQLETTGLLEENQQLSEQIELLRDDPAAIEERARGDLGLIKPGEKLFIIRDIAPDRDDSTATEESAEDAEE